jgi:hypothetical protein
MVLQQEGKDSKAMQDMLAKAVAGAFESFKQHTKNNKDTMMMMMKSRQMLLVHKFSFVTLCLIAC